MAVSPQNVQVIIGTGPIQSKNIDAKFFSIKILQFTIFS